MIIKKFKFNKFEDAINFMNLLEGMQCGNIVDVYMDGFDNVSNNTVTVKYRDKIEDEQ